MIHKFTLTRLNEARTNKKKRKEKIQIDFGYVHVGISANWELSWAELSCGSWRCWLGERCWQPDASSSYCQSYSPKAPQAAAATTTTATSRLSRVHSESCGTSRSLVNGCAKKHVHFHWVKVLQRGQRGWVARLPQPTTHNHQPHAAEAIIVMALCCMLKGPVAVK